MLFISSSVDGHLCFFHILAVINNTAVKTCVQLLCGRMFSFLLGVYTTEWNCWIC